MAGYRHILFATDLTDAAGSAGRRAVEQAACSGGRLTLLHVVEHYGDQLGGVPEDAGDPEAYLQRRYEERLAGFAEAIGASGAERRVVLDKLSARQAILKFIAAERPDLVILGAIAHPGALGTTVDGVAADSPCDVLVVQGGAWSP
jgi:universal stress protein A